MNAGGGRIIIVSNRLPLSVVEKRGRLSVDRSIGGLATALSSVFAKHEPLWVGWTGVRRILKASALKSLALPENIVPVQAPAKLLERYYDRFATRILWPVMHGYESAITAKASDYAAFEAMTARFARAVQAIAKPEDVIWVHDSHLMLLPQQLRALGMQNRIGFFLHTPFPPAKAFFRLSHGRKLLASLCEADVVGLQTERDVDNFWATQKQARSFCQPGLVRAFPIGVDFDLYRQSAKLQEVKRHQARLQKIVAGRRVILSISRLDYTKGILQQLKVVEQFMRQQANKQAYVYKLVVAPSRESVPEYRDLKRAIAKEVKRINKALGERRWQPIDYQYENIDFPEVAANYLLADILLLLPPIDGMNLVAKEYIATRAEMEGTVVLGNAIGAAYQLQAAVLVDSLDVAAAAKGLHHAVQLGAKERHTRWQELSASVQKQDVFWWAEQFLHTLEKHL
jgi:trehalose 6-phosphate synthase/phosphatase